MENKLEANTYNSLTEFIADAKLIFVNCRAYNDAGSNCKCPVVLRWREARADCHLALARTDVKNANKLESYLEEQVKVYLDE
jgi:histone acetyltransferase